MERNIAVLAECKLGSSDHLSAVVSSLAIIVVVKKYSIALNRGEVISLLNCVAFEADPSGKKSSVCEAVLAEFSIELRK